MKIDHLAALLTLADVHRSDVTAAQIELARLNQWEVTRLLDEALTDILGSPARTPPTLVGRVLRSELTPARLAKRAHLLEEYGHLGVRVISLWDNAYPESLKDIQNPPLVLIVDGAVFPGKRRVAIVGTRQSGPTGESFAFDTSRLLASRGWTIVSGLARGIDTQAHKGALAAGGTTLGVLAGHVGHVFPPENRGLFSQVRQAGALVSEISPFTPMHRGRFIERNRITSGLSQAVIIGEFHGQGGTFQQARFALSQRRPVFTLDQGEKAEPGIRKGLLTLVQMGAHSVTGPEDLIDRLGPILDASGNLRPKSQHRQAKL